MNSLPAASDGGKEECDLLTASDARDVLDFDRFPVARVLTIGYRLE